MKVKVTIEEVISQTFEVEIDDGKDAYDQIRAMYKNGVLVVEDPTLIEANVRVYDENGELADWNNLHV